MGWDITITAPEGYPDVQEPVHGFAQCSGNMYMSVLEMKEKQLRHMEREEAMQSLLDLIQEVDRGNEGRFSDDYAVASDLKWSEGKETRKEWEKWEPYAERMTFKTYEQFCGTIMRERIRKSAVRFLLYYKSGYKVEYEW